MFLVSFFLATHANAALAGLPVRFGEEEHEALRSFLWNSPGIDWGFYVPGPKGDRLRLSANDWIDTMHASGMRRATFSFGPTRELAGDGILAEGSGERWYYQCLYHKLEDSRDRILLKGRPVPDEFVLPSKSVKQTADLLKAEIRTMIAFADRYPNLTGDFSLALKGALDFTDQIGIGAAGEAVDFRVRSLYPAEIYPVDHQLLMSAALRASILGGMGSWNDFGPDAADRLEYERITREFANVLYPAYSTASYLDLPS